MPIGGSATELNITGAKLKVSGGVQVAGSIAYTTDATGFGGVTAQIDGNNTLNVTSGKLTGVTKIERSTAATITAITHTNVNNNTTIHIALKNTSSTRGDFITLETFASDDTVKVNYTDDYLIGPGETGMITLRKVDGVLSLFVREMFSDKASTFTNDATDGNRPFYIKDGVNYKYPLYKYSIGGSDLTSIVIGGTTYYRPSAGITSKSRPPKGIPELIVTPTGNLAIGNNVTGTTVNYDVWGVPSSFDFGSIYQGSTKKASFLLENGEASGSFTESGASSGDAYTLYVDRTDTSTSDTVTFDENAFIGTIAFHHDTFANSGDPYGDGTLAGATANNHVFTDTQTGTYDWGTLSGNALASTNTTYIWTPPNDISGADVLMAAGGGGGSTNYGGGGGAGGILFYEGETLSGQKTIVVGDGGIEVVDGSDTSFTGLTTVIGGGAAGNFENTGNDGGSGGGGGSSNASSTTYAGGNPEPGQGNRGGLGTNTGTGAGGYKGGGGGGGGTRGQDATESGTYVGGNGGAGLDYSSTFGTGYGHNGYFAGGGGGGVIHSNWSYSMTGGDGGIGGGGDGGDASSNQQKTPGSHGMAHTGGGGGGGGHTATGGSGGSGIVLIKTDGVGKKIPKITGISNVTTIDSKTINYTFYTQGTGIDKVTYKIGSGSEVTTSSGVYTLAYTPADFGTTTITHAYAVDSSGNQLGTKFGPYSVTTKQSSLGHITPPILLFMSMGTTVTDSVNSIAITQYTGTHTKNTSTNSIKNTGPGTMVIDFTSLRTSDSSDVTITWEVYLESGITWEEGFSIGNINSNADADSVGYLGTTNPTLHFEGKGQTNQQLSGSNISYSTYEGVWVKHTWMYVAGSNALKTYINGVLACTATPNSDTFNPESYFWLFCHARSNSVTSRPGDTNLICRNIEIYQASFTDAQILAAYGS